ncbi:hypothetical protein [Streptomyces sp. NPDC058247]|uniref:hypothetical protein n=1 Tax=Streptomyces sp. NPDC058247 TaxID=3346401 RepID=UPI0036EE047D
MQKSVNVLLCLVAVAGIGWSGQVIWQVWEGRRQINSACAGLVPAGRVLALSPAGGTVSHRVADEGTIELDAGLPQDCEIFSTEAGEKYGTHSGERWFFTGAVGTEPGNKAVIADDSVGDLLDLYSGHTYPAQPIGGGIAGLVTDSGVTVQLPCPEGKSAGAPIKALWASAALMDPGPPFTEDGQLTAHDRNTLAETAVLTANNLAERLGCADRLPDPPDDIPALAEGPTPASRADGTCAWYRRAGFARGAQYADQVLESRTDDKLWDEQCGLVLSDTRAADLWQTQGAKLDLVSPPSRPGRWFASFHTHSGEDAKNVQLRSTRSDEAPELAEPGKAGRSEERTVWWASSVCDGQPQIHTMTIGFDYARIVTPAYEKVFRAYVRDVTKRRGCTDVEFPDSATFRVGPDGRPDGRP